ncbi:MAG TPA: hypothetical protein DIT97_07390 [Gimesia maris]|jgi:hypothetical protein|uniref:Uncharacterized protein n=1 Tax=Gimesia maris TaxID=122 RepID=A0A3D3R218_9PLAN|nr:hypothetical protein [Gimesia maris]
MFIILLKNHGLARTEAISVRNYIISLSENPIIKINLTRGAPQTGFSSIKWAGARLECALSGPF